MRVFAAIEASRRTGYHGAVRGHQYVYLADLLRDHRTRLERLADDLGGRSEPLSEMDARLLQIEMRLLLEGAGARVGDVEHALRHAAYQANTGPYHRLRSAYLRARSWTKPRVGLLRHYQPRPLRVRASYLRTQPPADPPLISLVTPSYQQGRFLGRTLHSVVSQDYPALEYVVQDGASTDETLAVLERFAPRLTAWASGADGGQADAINRGFARTSGEIMAWLNSDDLLLPGSLAYVAQYFAAHPDVDVVYGHRVMIDDRDGQIGAWVLPKHDDRVLRLADYVPQETLFWRRRIWEAAGGCVDTSLRYAIDWDMLLRFQDAGARMVRLPRFLGAFRIHDEQKTTVINDVGAAEVDLLRQRLHGRYLTTEEVLDLLRPFFLRHILAHTRQRLLDRLPLPRVVVRTLHAAAPRLPQATERERDAAGAAGLASQAARQHAAPVAPTAPPADAVSQDAAAGGD